MRDEMTFCSEHGKSGGFESYRKTKKSGANVAL
jgi:hypothetical protein